MEQNEEKRAFRGVWIPAEVWLDTRLAALDKMILVEIDSLCIDGRGCYAGNKYIADFCQCSVTKVSTSISKLVKIGYLHSETEKSGQRILWSALSKTESPPFKNCKPPFQNLKDPLSKIESTPFKNCKDPFQKLKPINIMINKEINIDDYHVEGTKAKRKRKPFVPPTLAEVEAYCRERGNKVDAKRFYDYFTAGDWKDSKGNPVRNWKQKVITWESHRQDGGKTVGANGVAIADTADDLEGVF